ncbi:MAG: hypothetical protein IJV99_03250 [Clostridia bacterium]|nr:hypothetical protein [Clostridia bacterium]
MGKRKYLYPKVQVVSLTQVDVLSVSENDFNAQDETWNFNGDGGLSL